MTDVTRLRDVAIEARRRAERAQIATLAARVRAAAHAAAVERPVDRRPAKAGAQAGRAPLQTPAELRASAVRLRQMRGGSAANRS